MKRNTVLEDKRLFVVFAVGAALDDALDSSHYIHVDFRTIRIRAWV